MGSLHLDQLLRPFLEVVELRPRFAGRSNKKAPVGAGAFAIG
jgi:hypothetical protein